VTVFAVRWGSTPRPVLEAAFRKLRMNAKGNVGVVLSRVDLRGHARYQFGDFGYYHRQFKNYYYQRGTKQIVNG
jgi:polysaccharide biosynthesis transport protein